MIGLHDLPDVAWPLYCGPAAIAAFAGKLPEQVFAAINEVRGRDPIQAVEGMGDEEIVATLRLLGVPCGNVCQGQFETLRAFVTVRPDFVGVVRVTKHFVAVSNGWCLDNGSQCARPVALFRGNRKVVWNYIPVLYEDAQELSEYD